MRKSRLRIIGAFYLENADVEKHNIIEPEKIDVDKTMTSLNLKKLMKLIWTMMW